MSSKRTYKVTNNHANTNVWKVLSCPAYQDKKNNLILCSIIGRKNMKQRDQLYLPGCGLLYK